MIRKRKKYRSGIKEMSGGSKAIPSRRRDHVKRVRTKKRVTRFVWLCPVYVVIKQKRKGQVGKFKRRCVGVRNLLVHELIVSEALVPMRWSSWLNLGRGGLSNVKSCGQVPRRKVQLTLALKAVVCVTRTIVVRRPWLRRNVPLWAEPVRLPLWDLMWPMSS